MVTALGDSRDWRQVSNGPKKYHRDDDALHDNRMVADLCQTATIVHVFLWWGWGFLAKPKGK